MKKQKYTFEDYEELKDAIINYPDNIKVYGDCKYWDVSNIEDMSYIIFISNNYYN